MQFISLTTVLAAIAATGSTLAQPAAPSPNSNPGAAANGAMYRSAFDGYRRHADQPITSWRDANDTVGRIGGWQSYAREAGGNATADPASKMPAAKPTEPARKAEGPGGAGNAHGNHGAGGGK